MKPSPKSAVFQVFRSIQEQIVSGRIASGTHLVERKLCDEYGVSRPVVRETLIRLSEVGLVTTVHGAGATVKGITEAEVIDAYKFREAIETAAAEQCASRVNREEAEHLLQLADRFREEFEAFSSGGNHHLKELEHEFHERIVSGSRNAHLIRAWEIARIHLNLGSKSRPEALDPTLGRDSIVEEHAAIAAAVAKGDAAEAGRQMKGHIRRGREIYVEQIRSRSGALSSR